MDPWEPSTDRNAEWATKTIGAILRTKWPKGWMPLSVIEPEMAERRLGE
jgi:hypothetical protein